MDDAQVLKEIDRGFKEAAGPEEAGEAGSPDTAGEAGDIRALANDAGAPPGLILSDDDVRRAIRKLERDAGTSEEGLIQLVRSASRHEAHRAHRHGHRHGFHHGFAHAMHHTPHHGHHDVHWNRSHAMREFRTDIVNRYRRLHGGHVVEGIGFYYGTIEIVFSVEGTPTDAAFVLSVPNADSPIVDQAFNLAIDDVSTGWFGGPHTLNPSDTNLQNPGTNLYTDQLMIVEAVEGYFKGARINYASQLAQFEPQPQADIQAMLTGKELVWDRAGRVLPTEMFNQYDDRCELAQALAEASTFYFTWADKAVGGNKVINNKLINRFSRIPGISRLGLRETSGAGRTLDLPQGYLWTLDKMFQASSDTGGNGLFDAEIHVDESVAFPFQPIQLFGSPGPVLPDSIALYWQFCLWGTSLLPDKDFTRYEPQARRRL